MTEPIPHPHVELVRRLYAALDAVDLETILELFDPEVEVHQTEELPWGGDFHGHDGLGRFFGLLRENITSKVTIQAVYAAGDEVVQIGRTAGTVNANGAPFDVQEMHLLTVRDGKVVRFEAHIDTPEMLQALRATPRSG